MSENESLVYNFLLASPTCAFERKEIARKAVSRRTHEENPRWADAPLSSLVDQKLIEVDANAHYKFKPPAPPKKGKHHIGDAGKVTELHDPHARQHHA